MNHIVEQIDHVVRDDIESLLVLLKKIEEFTSADSDGGVSISKKEAIVLKAVKSELDEITSKVSTLVEFVITNGHVK